MDTTNNSISSSQFQNKLDAEIHHDTDESQHLQSLLKIITNSFSKEKENVLLRKKWIYKNTCCVLDFYYRGVKFAFDFTPKDNHLIDLSFVIRKRNTSASGGTTHEPLCLSNTLEECLLIAKSKLNEVITQTDINTPFDVTVVVPVYNREKLILGCIESLNNQTLDKSKFEIVFVDDYSKDKTVSAIDYHIQKDVNYRIIRRNVGSGNASTPRNEGIKAAQGRYIFFLDSDDRIDEKLLENGLLIAEKNDSDIVYFKIVADGDREVPLRPFKNKIVDKADITEHHLMRSLTVFKFFKLSMLKQHNILFNPQITVAEDKIFMVHALTAANTVSILADRDYHTLCFHGDDHLSRRKFPLGDRFFILNTVLTNIYFCDKPESEKRKLYNGWLVICLEMTEKLCKKLGRNNERLISFFTMLSSSFSLYSSYIDEEMIYEKQKKFITAFMGNDIHAFCDLV
ncbi:glycosyltransferase family 2 protein [Leclercia sp. W6]|uniref:glycosyltransferase family 2 protein n=1 Tax=Leclercia sp. W6 TaxID=2282310 RepID=UPI000DF157E6|nr:glycosyltransferase family 2 protein [Leclercia sp. W6]AXF62419.1 glycosyltransferase family 2 protein [Leclercia sp. W6]